MVIVAGLTGGFGSGKSTALRVFRKMGAFVIDADRLARDVVKPGQPAWREIKTRFGEKVFYRNNRLNRKRLAGIVFRDRKALKELNAIIHPRVLEEEKRLTREYQKKHKNGVVVVDAPMMIESGSHKWKDVLIVMNTSRENQTARLLKTGRWKKAEIEKRISAQLPLPKKLKLADYVIDNNGTLAECRKNAECVFRKILKKASARSA
jgi:dephospho-CoA kinase